MCLYITNDFLQNGRATVSLFVITRGVSLLEYDFKVKE